MMVPSGVHRVMGRLLANGFCVAICWSVGAHEISIDAQGGILRDFLTNERKKDGGPQTTTLALYRRSVIDDDGGWTRSM